MKSLKAKVSIPIIALLALSNLAIGLLTGAVLKGEITDSAEKILTLTARNISLQMDEANNREFRMLTTLAQLASVRDSYAPLPEKIQTVSPSTTIDKNYISVSVFNAFGYTYDEGGRRIDIAESEMYDETMLGKKFITDPAMNSGVLSMIYSAPIFDDEWQPAGAVYASVKAERMSAVCSSITVGKDSHPLIVNMKSGKIIGAADSSRLNSTLSGKDKEFEKILDALLKGEASWGTYREDGRKMVASFMPIGQSCSWAVLCAAPYSDYFGVVARTEGILGAVIVISLAAGVALLFVVLTRSLRPLKSVKHKINAIAAGNADLTARLPLTSNDEIGDVVRGFNAFSEKLQSIISDVKHSKDALGSVGESLSHQVEETGNSIGEVLSEIDSVQREIGAQNSDVEKTSSSIRSISQKIESLNREIDEQSAEIEEASNSIHEMVESIKSMGGDMDAMSESFGLLLESAGVGTARQNDVNEKIRKIQEQSKMLNEANKAIATIASETNLLAMNAAIEAAHAGEAGRGFSVVADEIRTLSETSANQSKSIGRQLKEINESIQAMVASSEQSKVSFADVSAKISGTNEVVSRIKGAIAVQSENSKQMGHTLESINEKTAFVRESSAQMAEDNRMILSVVAKLQESSGSLAKKTAEMEGNLGKIRGTSQELNEISDSVEKSIGEIGNQIDQFKV